MMKMRMLCVSGLILGLVLAAGCDRTKSSTSESRVVFRTGDCGEFTFPRREVVAFLEKEKAGNPKAAALLARLEGTSDDAHVELDCGEYCPVLFNGLLAAGSDFVVRCKDCDATVPFEVIKGTFASSSNKDIQYVDAGGHILIDIKLPE